MEDQQQRDDIARVLFKHHSHLGMYLKGEYQENEEEYVENPSLIIYTEDDVVEILKELGHPEPDWTYWDRDPKNPKNKAK
jgi:hypothetical protein